MSLDKVRSTISDARRITISKESTTIVAGEDSQAAVADRVASIRRELENTESEYDRRNSPSASPNWPAVWL